MGGALASLRPCEIDVEAGDSIWTIPALPAADWIEAVISDRGGAIFPGLLRDDELERQLWRDVTRGTVTSDDLVQCAQHALEAAAGRSWWAADRLIRVATDETVRARILGELAAGGLDLERISLGLFCDAIWARMIANADEEQRWRLEAELNAVPAGVDPEDLEEDDDEAEFLAQVGDRGSGG